MRLAIGSPNLKPKARSTTSLGVEALLVDLATRAIAAL